MKEQREAYADPIAQKGAMSVDEFCAWASIGRNLFYDEVKAQRLVIRKIGRRTVITLPDAIAWLQSLPAAS